MFMTQKKAIVRLGIPKEAGSMFKHALVHPRSKEMLAIRTNPTLALTALQSGDEALGVNARTSADILEEVVENQPIDKARELMKLHLTKERLVQLLAARGDLDSTAAMYADSETLIAAIDAVLSERLPQAGKDGDDPESEDVSLTEPDQVPEAPEFDTVCRWAYKLKDRPDYQDLLLSPLCGGSTSMRYILAQGFLDEVRNQPAPSSSGASRPLKEDDDDTLRNAAYRQAFTESFFPERACVLLGIDGADGAEALSRIVEEEVRMRMPISRRASKADVRDDEDSLDKASDAIEDAQDAAAEVQEELDID